MPDLTNLARLREIIAAATPRVWRCEQLKEDARDQVVRDQLNRYVAGLGRINGKERVNGDLIAAAANTLPALVAACEKVNRAIDEYHKRHQKSGTGEGTLIDAIENASDTLDRELGAAMGDG